jgi:hypothetical protein
MAVEAENAERARWIKSRLVRLRTDYENGIIDDKTYAMREEEILRDLRNGASA